LPARIAAVDDCGGLSAIGDVVGNLPANGRQRYTSTDIDIIHSSFSSGGIIRALRDLIAFECFNLSFAKTTYVSQHTSRANNSSVCPAIALSPSPRNEEEDRLDHRRGLSRRPRPWCGHCCANQIRQRRITQRGRSDDEGRRREATLPPFRDRSSAFVFADSALEGRNEYDLRGST
jgi:hypothetical protein